MVKKFDFKSHIPIKGKSGKNQGYREVPYVVLAEGGSPRIVFSQGKFYGSGGTPIEDGEVPEWAKNKLNRLNAKTRASLGISDEPPSAPVPEAPSEDEDVAPSKSKASSTRKFGSSSKKSEDE